MRRVLTVLACAALVLTGCGTPRDPEVTFYSAGKTIRFTPTFYCDDARGEKNCGQRAEPTTLKVPPGQPVQISVPGQLAEGRWVVTYTYIDASESQIVGEQSKDILGRGEDYTYTVTVPDKADQITQIAVQEIAAVVMDDGSLAPRGAWVIDVPLEAPSGR